ncbi:hypothetical protein [Flavobacterium sp. N2820]|uniref:hypothetical protein n=1 Tax=Flavobacterium sp. N2820 TaxID=2986834 RepID=UPI002225B527|nr:hypothetical protein [Flavobacterium sp. N2820]
MNVYKLKYKNKETAIADLIAKGVYIETEEGLIYGEGVQAVVEIGLIVLEDGVYDEEGNEITPPIYAEGYHYDIMCEQKIDFGAADITSQITKPKHSFAG